MDNRRSKQRAIQPTALTDDPVLDFMRLLWSVEHGLQSRSKWMEATLGVTGPQRLVLRIVSDRPGLSAGELAEMVHLHPSTITGIVQRLVRNGLLQRTRDPHDRRRIRLRVRGSSQRLLAVTSGTVESAVTRALTGAMPHRVRHARAILESIADALFERPAEGAISSRTRPRVVRTPARRRLERL